MNAATPPDMTITLEFRKVDEGVNITRHVRLGSEELLAAEAAMEPRHHDALNALLRKYSEPFIGVFLVASDLKALQEVVGGGVQ